MPTANKLVVFELNEVPFRVLDEFVRWKPKSNLARMMGSSDIFETFAQDEGHLSPWITWPTMHRGVTNADHEIFDFGQDLSRVDKEFPPIWSLLAKAGVRVGMFGSLHSYPLPRDLDNYAFYVPDTFAAGPECFPHSLEAFQSFNLAMVDASARNVSTGLALDKALPFLKAAPGLGLRGKTVLELGKQIAREKVQPHLSCRRRTSQVQIAFDFYLQQLRKNKPDVSFFFTNHVASSLHRYWPGAFPKDYKEALWADGYTDQFAHEIEYTMSVADQMIGDLMRFCDANSGHRLLVMTSMGQQAVEGAEAVSTQLYCVELPKLMSALGVPSGWEKRRAMAPQYVVGIEGEPRATLLQNVDRMRINGQPVHHVEHEGTVMIEFGQANLTDDIHIAIGNTTVSPAEAGLRNVEIQDRSATFAYHIPEGMLLSYDPAKRAGLSQKRERISTTEVAPAILHNFGVQHPSYMRSGLHLS